MKKKIIATALVLILIVSFSGCLGPPADPEKPLIKDDKIDSDKKASEKTSEVGDDLEGISGSLKDLDDDL